MSLLAHLDQLRILNERLTTVLNRVRNCGDAFNGSQPEPDRRPSSEHISGHTLNNQFGEIITEIQMKIEMLQEQVARVEDNVLDQPGRTTAASKGY